MFLATTVSVYAQKGHGGGGGGQHQQQARTSQRQPQRTQQAERTQRAGRNQQQSQRMASNHGNNGFHGNGNNGHHYGQISDVSYRAHFGNGHSFRMMRPQMIDGFERFQYSGYWFGYNQPWPSDWAYTDRVYVQYMDSSYYLYDLRHPGIHISLNIF